MNIFITGSAGFIGFHVTKKLLNLNYKIAGIDNLNLYYSKKLKQDRLSQLLKLNKKYKHYNLNINNFKKIDILFRKYKPKYVIHFAAQAGVRYSLKNPQVYIDSNIKGFFNILECCKKYKIKHLIYASSSSVYGDNKKIPYSIKDKTDQPISLYAATKKSNELMAYAYSSIYNMNTTGLRFFTVYGPWGRPDMALFKFTKKILKKKEIEIFNYGNHLRDFTYIDDIVDAVIKVFKKKLKGGDLGKAKIYNIGNNKPIKLMKYIEEIEKNLKLIAKKKYLPLQKGDVIRTFAEINSSKKDFGYSPKINYKVGIKNFISWYKKYYKF